MANRQCNIDADFKLRPFVDRDYVGLVDLKNIIYQDHPFSVESLRYRDNTREKKIKYRCWVWEKNKNIFHATFLNIFLIFQIHFLVDIRDISISRILDESLMNHGLP